MRELYSKSMADRWDSNDHDIIWPWLLRGVYEMKGGVIGRTVLMTKVVEYIKLKDYWGQEEILAKYLRISAGNSYRHNLYKITRWMIDRGFLRPHSGFDEVSITRQGINILSKHFPEIE